MPSSAGVLGLAFSSRQVVFVPDARTEPRWFEAARVQASGLRSVFAVPLLYKGEAIGVVGLDSPRFSADHPPGRLDIQRLEALASQAAIAVTNARLYSDSERDRGRLRALLRERSRLRQHVGHLRDEVRAAGAFGDILGVSPAFTAVLEQALLVAPGDTTTLLLGETGTGKELLARFIHERSNRRKGPLVAVNCAALPEALVESELFGHERGAFTGALARKIGKFELAHRGSLFLDEIGDLPAEAQAKLLRVLQDGLVQRVGSASAVPVDVRVIAATNQDLEAAIAVGRFRSDLFYRLSVFPVRIPPLRDRLDDIGLLAQHFVRRSATRLHRPVEGLTDEAVAQLRAYQWPGNVRELQNVIERAVILASHPLIGAEDLGLPSARAVPRAEPGPGALTLADAERHAILEALEATSWRISGRGGAAERLALKPTTLHAKMKKLGIRRPRA
ncbi:MAG: sigma 54-interacting transcriptional regulator [Vicinamibacterales bacterium]|nr:sigma 54-interacting transcriptional regulator [Vicinamibacterales bacterium]